MSNEERIAQLIKAASLIEEVAQTFSSEKEVCSCCGLSKYVNWNERSMRDELNGAINRCKKIIDRIERG